MKQWQAVSIGQLQHQLVTGSKLFCYQSWVSHVGYFHEGTASASAKIEHNSNRCHGEMYFDIVLVYYHQQEKRTPPRPTTRQQQGRRGKGQAMQLALHDLTGQLCGSGCVCRPEFSIIRLKNNSIYLKPDESFVDIGVSIS